MSAQSFPCLRGFHNSIPCSYRSSLMDLHIQFFAYSLLPSVRVFLTLLLSCCDSLRAECDLSPSSRDTFVTVVDFGVLVMKNYVDFSIDMLVRR